MRLTATLLAAAAVLAPSAGLGEQVRSGHAVKAQAATAAALSYPSLIRAGNGIQMHVTPEARPVGTGRFSVAPDLPPGLTLDPTTGAISGAPVRTAARSLYVALLRDEAGSHVTTFELEVVGQPIASTAGLPSPREARPPRVPGAGSGSVLLATASEALAVHRSPTPRSPEVIRLAPGDMVRVVATRRVAGSVRLRVVLPGRAAAGWARADGLRYRVVSERTWLRLATAR